MCNNLTLYINWCIKNGESGGIRRELWMLQMASRNTKGDGAKA